MKIQDACPPTNIVSLAMSRKGAPSLVLYSIRQARHRQPHDPYKHLPACIYCTFKPATLRQADPATSLARSVRCAMGSSFWQGWIVVVGCFV